MCLRRAAILRITGTLAFTLCLCGCRFAPRKQEIPLWTATGPGLLSGLLRDGVALDWALATDVLDEQSGAWIEDLTERQHAEALSVGYPLRPHERLRVKYRGKAWIASWPCDLRGVVHIRNTGEALEFARFFSAPDNAVCFPEFPYMEVSPEPLIGQSVGVMDSGQFRELGLPKATVVKRDGVYRILRPAVKLKKVRFHPSVEAEGVAILDETIDEDGGYRLMVLWEKAISLGVDQVSLPSYR